MSMYRPRPYAIDDGQILREVLRKRVFATLAAIVEGRVAFAYAPLVVDARGLRFHLARANPLASLDDGMRVSLSVLACDAYISPDWYRTTVTVPTWNYISVECEGPVRRLPGEELRPLVVELSAQEEARLAPKPEWTLDKVPEARVEALLNGITGFAMSFERLEGKFKLSQDKSPEDVAGAIEALESRGDAAGRAVAEAMRRTRQ
ncbi:MAG: FMN-binding negative transcriptional regulator [Alphaproteobacteria bacterium]|nr:FMN-binding negative transcriptional regulator [Alphaproteobacteria bacterium]MBV9695178.1 FMN-binding negative transcriptional regulator [Alphaproteobacteria bacterium]